MVAMPNLMTAAQLASLDIPHKRTELVRGRLMVSEPPGIRHGDVVARVTLELGLFVREASRGLQGPIGRVFAGDAGFWIERDPDTVRGPDVAFVSSHRLPSELPAGFATFAPSLAVEVLSPSDRAGKVLTKVADWLNAGAELVWVIDPERRLARVYRADGSETMCDASSSLQGEGVLPGFVLPLTELFD